MQIYNLMLYVIFIFAFPFSGICADRIKAECPFPPAGVDLYWLHDDGSGDLIIDDGDDPPGTVASEKQREINIKYKDMATWTDFYSEKIFGNRSADLYVYAECFPRDPNALKNAPLGRDIDVKNKVRIPIPRDASLCVFGPIHDKAKQRFWCE